VSKLPGIVLVVAGVGIAASTISYKTTVVPDFPLHDLSAQIPPAAPSGQVASASISATAWDASVTPAPRQTAEPTVQTIVLPAKRVAVAELPPRIPVSQKPRHSGPPLDSMGLAREIQRHLKRVGCYDGELNGIWSPSVRRSMKSFTDHVNAALPNDAPSSVLLAMVESYPGPACGRSCPAGQGLADNGRCVPTAVLTHTATAKPASPDLGLPATPPAIVPLAPLDGRMALAGPKAEQSPSPADALAPTQEHDLNNDAQAKLSVRSHTKRTSTRHRDAQRGRRADRNRFPAWAAPVATP
jgi:hypothetical protein